MSKSNTRLVYSTATGRVCPRCAQPASACACRQDSATAPVPARLVAKLRLEKKGRGGKTVTVVYDLPLNASFLRELSQELKRACGTGGAVAGDTIELQGDQRANVRSLLAAKGMQVKG